MFNWEIVQGWVLGPKLQDQKLNALADLGLMSILRFYCEVNAK